MKKFSFVICTRNRAGQLTNLLSSISRAVAAVPEHTFDLTLVDNGSTDATADVFESWAHTAPIKAVRIYSERVGLAASRNVGIRTATGDILIFTDDDCVLSPEYCADMVACFSRNFQPRILGGRVELGDVTDAPFTIKTSPTSARLEGATHPGGFVLGCNMVVPRAIFAEIGVFDERFGAGARYLSGEETDILYRAHRAEIPVEYVPNMAVYHFHGRKLGSDIKRLNYGYHFGTGALYSKYFFSDPKFVKHIFWMLRSAFREYGGGPSFDPGCNLSHWTVVKGNLAGFGAFTRDRILGAFLKRDTILPASPEAAP